MAIQIFEINGFFIGEKVPLLFQLSEASSLFW